MEDEKSAKRHIILVEDDSELAELIGDFLRRYNFEVSIVDNGTEAVEQIITTQPDLVILDIMLPGMNRMEVCKAVRSQYSGYILMQTALDDDIDQMMGLENGADDYVVKQVKPHLLLSRINALLRRSQRHQNTNGATHQKEVLQCGPLTININNRKVDLNNQPVDLTTAEFELLVLLANSIGSAVSRDEIVQKIRGFEYDGQDRSIDRRISRLRKKLQLDNGEDLIKTIRGVGYQLCIYSE